MITNMMEMSCMDVQNLFHVFLIFSFSLQLCCKPVSKNFEIFYFSFLEDDTFCACNK